MPAKACRRCASHELFSTSLSLFISIGMHFMSCNCVDCRASMHKIGPCSNGRRRPASSRPSHFLFATAPAQSNRNSKTVMDNIQYHFDLVISLLECLHTTSQRWEASTQVIEQRSCTVFSTSTAVMLGVQRGLSQLRHALIALAAATHAKVPHGRAP